MRIRVHSIAGILLLLLVSCTSNSPARLAFTCSDPVLQELFNLYNDTSAATSIAPSAWMSLQPSSVGADPVADSVVARWDRLEELSRKDKSYEVVPLLRDSTTAIGLSPNYLLQLLFREVVGIRKLDTRRREVVVQLSGPDLDFCKGVIPLDTDSLVVSWDLVPPLIVYSIHAPRGYKVTVENNSPFKLMSQQELDRKYQEAQSIQKQ